MVPSTEQLPPAAGAAAVPWQCWNIMYSVKPNGIIQTASTPYMNTLGAFADLPSLIIPMNSLTEPVSETDIYAWAMTHEQGFQRITLRMQLLQLLQCTEEHVRPLLMMATLSHKRSTQHMGGEENSVSLQACSFIISRE